MDWVKEFIYKKVNRQIETLLNEGKHKEANVLKLSATIVYESFFFDLKDWGKIQTDSYLNKKDEMGYGVHQKKFVLKNIRNYKKGLQLYRENITKPEESTKRKELVCTEERFLKNMKELNDFFEENKKGGLTKNQDVNTENLLFVGYNNNNL